MLTVTVAVLHDQIRVIMWLPEAPLESLPLDMHVRMISTPPTYNKFIQHCFCRSRYPKFNFTHIYNNTTFISIIITLISIIYNSIHLYFSETQEQTVFSSRIPVPTSATLPRLESSKKYKAPEPPSGSRQGSLASKLKVGFSE